MAGGQEREPTNLDGPLFQATERRAADVDDAQTPGERRRAWARLVPTAVAALVESELRRFAIIIAVVVSVAVVLTGATADEPGWVVAGLAAGVLGIAFVFVAMFRWSVGRQWVVSAGVVALQIALLVVHGQTT